MSRPRPDDQIAQAIWRAYARESVSMADLMREVQLTAGSGRKAAKLVGIGETTWRRWKSGQTTPRPENFTKLDWAFRFVRVDKVGPLNPAAIVIRTTDINDRKRHRRITGSQLQLDPGGLQRVAAAYAAGDPDAASAAFLRAVGERWYRQYLSANADTEDYGGIVNSMEI